ncbi:PIG-L deacetylase family protein [Deinococcus yavapaiensis]|uniref:N-acetyl-1-D-myo-inositol-2-amino-2-deoxy-alpha-D-glucopyranoside deacetylase n=1 Tax=Deinococcus yavapaiensis KR-236 TaxID=694435 RepID=A0A318S334_9DEIO|nr:PIG-L family deacetylase [Deinococcus yavapaiensis]PYE50419.1 N-acetyl-1-D-myo-inositol-2-amino-2-deoxy-alpha-D-glucopyranoside deacetylase [Deinococcus yavapaiensis KR-236]
MAQPSLLAVFAHPDDEALRCGGTLAHYAAQGARITLVCATRGEAGRVTDPSLGHVEDVAALREQELKDACAHLGIGEPVFLGYHDSGRGERLRRDDPLATINVDLWEIEARILEVIARVQPHVMLTFDPHGIYGHPDHLIVHRAATAAFYSSGCLEKPVQRLYYTAQTRSEMQRMQGSLGVLAGLDPDTYGVSDCTVAVRVGVSRYAPQKRRALYAHRTQTGPLSTLGTMPDEVTKNAYEYETFSLGGSRTTVPRYPLRGFFDGLPVARRLKED